MIKSSSNKKIAKNTLVLYLRMMIVMAINLYSVRLVLNALGSVDYGIYNVIGGVISMLSCVTSVLSTSTQRFYSYSIGENNISNLKKIFSTSSTIYLLLSLAVFILGETVGLWFVNNQLVIPEDRMIAANWIYQFSILSFIASMMQAPYSSATIAHEDMGVFAGITLIECLLKFGAAVTILFISTDKLILYGLLILLVYIFAYFAFFFTCRSRYSECFYTKTNDKILFNKILSFSGWTLFGSIASVGMNQVITILLNIFFGPIANAARAIAIQINGAIGSFSGSFIMAVRPPMIKAYAEGNYEFLNNLFNISNKMIFYLLGFILLPLYFEMDYIILLWLNKSDPQTILFSRLILIYAFIISLNNPITIIMQAMGVVRKYFVPVEVFTLACPILCYVLFKLGLPAESAFYLMILMAVLSHIMRLICLKRYYKGADLKKYLLDFLFRAITILLVTIVFLLYIQNIISSSLNRLLVDIVISFSILLGGLFFVGMTKSERHQLTIFVKSNILKK